MALPRLPAVVPALALACADRPLIATDEPPASTSGGATTGPGTGGPTGEPTDSGAPGTGTTDTDPPPSTSSTSTSSTDTGDATTDDPPPAGCAPCDRTWEHRGNLDITPDTDFADLACLVAVHGHVFIKGDIAPEQLAPLCHLRRVDQSLSIRFNASLTDLAPFAAVEEIGALDLYDLPALTVVALPALREASLIDVQNTGATALGSFAPDFAGVGLLRLSSNPALADLSAMVDWGLADPFSWITLHDLPALADLTDLAALFALPDGNFLFTMSNMPGLTSLAGLEGASSGDFDLAELPLVTDLKPLAGVTTLGALRLRDIPLTDLDGLGALQTAVLYLTDMPQLQSLAGLGPLAGSAVQLRQLPQLASLQGLENLQSGDLTLVDLPLVDSLAPLAGLTTAGSLTMFGMPKVTSLAGLHNLKSAGWLSLGDCVNEGTGGMDGLVDLTGLGALASADMLTITNGANLQSLAGADSLTSVTSELKIVNNPELTQPAFDAFLAGLDAPGNVCFGDWGACDCVEIIPP